MTLRVQGIKKKDLLRINNIAVRTKVSESGIGNLDYAVRLDQHVPPLQASVRIAVRPVGNPGTAEGEVCTLWVAVGAGRVQRSGML